MRRYNSRQYDGESLCLLMLAVSVALLASANTVNSYSEWDRTSGPRTLNCLSDGIIHNSALAVFKRSVKTYFLLRSHFCHGLRPRFRDSIIFTL